MHVIAAKAVAFKEAMEPEFKVYQQQVIKNAQAMAAVGQAFGGPDDLYQALVGLVGSQTSEANNNQTSAQALSDSTAAQLSSVDGVDTNQETVNMLSAQQAYQATAAVINSTTTALEALLAAV